MPLARTHLQRLLAIGVALLVALASWLAFPPPALANGTVQGSVLADGGGGVAEVTVTLEPPGGGTPVATATTTAGGGYSLAAPAGTYDLVATPPAGSPYQPSTVTDVIVTDGSTTSVDVVLVLVDESFPISGTLTIEGAPVAGASVSAGGGSGSVTDATGAWSLEAPERSGTLSVLLPADCSALPERPWQVRAFTPYDVDRFTEYPIALRFVTLDVDVVDPAGSPVEGATVSTSMRALSDPDIGPLGGTVTADNDASCAVTTDAAGSVALPVVPGSSTTVVATAAGFSLGRTTVEVGDADGTATVELPVFVDVTGTVLGWDGTPVANVRVIAGREVVSTDATGTFSIPVASGDRELRLSRGTAGLVPFSWQAQIPVTVGAAPLELGTWQIPAAAYDVSVELSDTGESIRARLLPGGRLVNVDAFGFPATVSAGSGTYFSDATFPLVLLDGATHTVVINSDDVPDGYEDPRTEVTVGAAGTRSDLIVPLDPVAVPTAPLSGTIVRDGVGVEGVAVSWRTGSGPFQTVRTGPDGSFSGLAEPGTLDVRLGLGSIPDVPSFVTARTSATVPTDGLDLGSLELPFIGVDLRVGTPAGEPPVDVEVETIGFVEETLDTGWGSVFWRTGYTESTGDSIVASADGTTIPLWFLPTNDTVRLLISPAAGSTYEPVELSRSFQTDGEIIQVELQRTATTTTTTVPVTTTTVAPTTTTTVPVTTTAPDPSDELRAPSQVFAGETVTLGGEGFEPLEVVRASLFSDPVVLGEGIADQSGVASLTVTVPADTPPGDHTFQLLGLGSGRTLEAPVEVLVRSETTTTVAAQTGAEASTTTVVGAGDSLPETGRDLSILPAVVLLVGGFALVLGTGRRRRTE